MTGIPNSAAIATAVATALTHTVGEGWVVDAAVASTDGQLTVFATTGGDSPAQFLVPVMVGQPVPLNDQGSMAHADHRVDDCGADHNTSCCHTHGTHAPLLHRNCILR